MEFGLVVGEVPVDYLSTAEVPLNKVSKQPPFFFSPSENKPGFQR